MARAVASPTAATSVRIFFIRSSGTKGFALLDSDGLEEPEINLV